MIQEIKNLLITITNMLLSFLPGSPFKVFIAQLDKIPGLGYLNYFVPVAEMVAIGQAWLTCVVIYYLYQSLMRFVKLIE